MFLLVERETDKRCYREGEKLCIQMASAMVRQ